MYRLSYMRVRGIAYDVVVDAVLDTAHDKFIIIIQ
jgi:hypothetical protein